MNHHEESEENFVEGRGIEPKEGELSHAILLGFYDQTTSKTICEEHLEELHSLADTFGVETVGKMAAPIRKIDSATYVGSGKLAEVADELSLRGANLLIIDDEIKPSQQRNLEKILKVAVMDRTELIIEIFAQRAQTREAKLQIELAKVEYQFPRLKRLWSHFSRQRASGGYLKGEGEKQIEMDRRMLKVELQRLHDELKEVERYRKTQRSLRQRSGIATFSIVGYTNAGKSTLLNALTDANVLVEDKLFATLDPTTRKFILPNNQEVLLTDTVGLIRKLPHTLVHAFKSTLEAALHDDVLLHLIDVSHPSAEEHAEVAVALLKELGASEGSIITVLNKIDKCEDSSRIARLRAKYPKVVSISATRRHGFSELIQLMMQEIAAKRTVAEFRIPQNEYAKVTQLRRIGKVLEERYEENDVLIRAELSIQDLHLFASYRLGS